MARRRKKVLDGLTAAEGQAVLRLLLERHPGLVREAEALAVEVGSSVDREAVAQDVVAAIGMLSLDDLGARAGRKSWGYVGPGEAAQELLEETVEGHLANMARLADLGLEDGARATCEGVLLGLYRLRGLRGHEVLMDADDFPVETFAWTLEQWLKAAGPSKGRRRLDDHFADVEIPDWGWLVDRVTQDTR